MLGWSNCKLGRRIYFTFLANTNTSWDKESNPGGHFNPPSLYSFAKKKKKKALKAIYFILPLKQVCEVTLVICSCHLPWLTNKKLRIQLNKNLINDVICPISEEMTVSFNVLFYFFDSQLQYAQSSIAGLLSFKYRDAWLSHLASLEVDQ